jgi:cytochrome P450
MQIPAIIKMLGLKDEDMQRLGELGREIQELPALIHEHKHETSRNFDEIVDVLVDIINEQRSQRLMIESILSAVGTKAESNETNP